MIYSTHGHAVAYVVKHFDGRYAGFVFSGTTPFFECWLVVDDYGNMVAV